MTLGQLKEKMEGKCVKEGYIKPDSIRILSYSSGVLKDITEKTLEILLEEVKNQKGQAS